MASPEYTLLMQGEYLAALQTAMSNLLDYGLVWLIMGLIIFGVVHTRTKSYALSGIMFIIYTALIIPAGLVYPGAEPFMALLVGIMLTALILKIIKK